MVNNIITKVLSMDRVLKNPKNRSNASIITPPATPARITRVFSTYGSDSNLLKVVEKFEPNLASSPSPAPQMTVPLNLRYSTLSNALGQVLKTDL